MEEVHRAKYGGRGARPFLAFSCLLESGGGAESFIVLCFIVLCGYGTFYKLKVCGNSLWSRSISAIFLIALFFN